MVVASAISIGWASLVLFQMYLRLQLYFFKDKNVLHHNNQQAVDVCICTSWLPASSGSGLIFGTGWARGSNPASLGGTHGDGQEGDQTKTLQHPHKIYVKIKVKLIAKIQNNDSKS